MRTLSKLLVLLVTIAVVITLVPVAYAHPGRTDGRGGHTDQDTGEYHYHHGYPAHDHYDMDGDGVKDCPYDFHDKTGSNSGGESSGLISDSVSDYPVDRNEKSEEESEMPSWVYWLIGGQAVFIISLLNSNRRKKNQIDQITNKYREDMESTQKAYTERLSEKNASDAELERTRRYISGAKQELDDILWKIRIENKNLSDLKQLRSRMKKAPLDISFSEDGLPVFWKQRKDKPYGDYTVYISLRSDIFHVDKLCGGYRCREEHIFNVIKKARPCKKCAEGFFDFDSVPDWYSGSADDIIDIPSHEPSLKINWRDQ